MMENYRILIVEDEILIADTIGRYLSRRGHEVVGIAISYEEALEIYQKEQPDIVLLDIRLNGLKTGIDFARYINSENLNTPFIYLTSQLDNRSINEAKETFPAGYLSKPIQKESLFATIQIAMHSSNASKAETTPTQEEAPSIQLVDGTKNIKLTISKIAYLEADHVYTIIHLVDKKQIMQRSPLREVLDQLPEEFFIQTHRSFAINIRQVGNWDQNHVFVHGRAIPISRSKKKIVHICLERG